MREKTQQPVVGKHILSTLTIGMYQDPRMIYREYIQNSADQIDTLTPDERQNNLRQTIVIDIDREKRRVTITDQATGIPRAEFRATLLNVADSKKDPVKNKGFRGIGRLAGLNYCRKLIFESTAKGETARSRLEMDGMELVRILHDNSDRSLAGEVIERISKVSYEEDGAKDYNCEFKVTLEDVRLDVGKELLDVDSVKLFVSQIAPVPFSRMNFRMGERIAKEAREAGVRLEEYTVQINGATITKPYKDVLYDAQGRRLSEVGEPQFRTFVRNGKKLAWGWFALPLNGVSLSGVKNPERKIRLRKGNIQIGFEDFLDPYFPEARSNGYMIGEIHLISDAILPNGDRNALEVSEEAAELTEILKNEQFRDLWNAAHKANELKNARKAIQEYRNECDEVRQLEEKGLTAAVEAKRADLEASYKKAVQGEQKLQKAASSRVRGDFTNAVVGQLACRDGLGEIDTPDILTPAETEKPKKAVGSARKSGDCLKNIIIRVLSSDGIDPMRASRLAERVDEEFSEKA